MTLADRLKSTENRPSGFDYLRISLAIAVIASHVPLVCYGWAAQRQLLNFLPARVIVFFIVPSFFALSGFLVSGSLDRNSLTEFLTLRAVRIFPALVAEVILSAFLIGAAVTVLPLGQYFSSGEFFRYFLNMMGWIHYTLPGVFSNQPVNLVNLQLWTVPRELDCYLLISLLSLVGLYRRPRILVGALLAVGIGILIARLLGLYVEHDNQQRGDLAIMGFAAGVALYALRGTVAFDGRLFGVALMAAAACLAFPLLTSMSPLPLAYVTIYLGLLNPKRTAAIKGADYSYGMYLYGFPIQQLIVYVMPELRVWYVNLPLAVIISAVFAYASWTLIEKPVHEQRRTATRFVSNVGGRFVRRSPV